MHIIAGSRKHFKLAAPKGSHTRPTSERLRESLFNICQSYIDRARFLDLFAGSGAVGFEALSRGADHSTFIDNNRESIRCIKDNTLNLDFKERTSVIEGDVFSQLMRLAKQEAQFDIIYADPPYGMASKLKSEKESLSDRLLRLIDKETVLAPEGMLFIEEDAGYKPKIAELQYLKLLSSRKSGRSILHHFQKIKAQPSTPVS